MGTKKRAYESVDEVFIKINGWGRYQWFLAFIYGYHFTVVYVNDSFMAFGGTRPKFHCADDAPYAYNNSVVSSINEHCDLYYNCSKANFSYVSEFYTIVEEYELVCDKSDYVSLISSLQFIGIMLGAMVSGPIVDYFGRKWTFLVIVGIEIMMGCLVVLASSWEVQALMRFLIGFAGGADMNAGWVYLGEFTVNRYRFLFRAVANILPQFSFPLCAYITKDWKYFELLGNLICVPLLAIIPFTCFESPRWLIQQGRHEEAAKILTKIGRLNGNKTFEVTAEELPDAPESRREHFWKLFQGRTMIKYSLCISITWFMASMITYGMLLDVGNLPFDIYTTQFLLAFVFMTIENGIAILDTYYPQKMNRRVILLVALLCAAGINLIIGILFFSPVYHQPNLYFLFSILSVFGRSSISVVFDTAYVYSIELFPTLLRSTAGAMCSVSARLGSIVAPQLLNVEVDCVSCMGIPYVAFAAFGLIGWIVDFFLLPNTKDKQLMENVSDDLKAVPASSTSSLYSSSDNYGAKFDSETDQITTVYSSTDSIPNKS